MMLLSPAAELLGLSLLQNIDNWSVLDKAITSRLNLYPLVPCLLMLIVPGCGEVQAHFSPGHLEVAQCFLYVWSLRQTDFETTLPLLHRVTK